MSVQVQSVIRLVHRIRVVESIVPELRQKTIAFILPGLLGRPRSFGEWTRSRSLFRFADVVPQRLTQPIVHQTIRLPA